MGGKFRAYSPVQFLGSTSDNATNLSVLSQSLKSVGYRVRVAIDGENAIAQVERKPPDLILLDVQMPGIDGFETCRRLKANKVTQPIPIIFMTALTDTASKVKGLSLGAVDYIPKPFEEEEVLARVKTHLQLKTLTDHLEQQVAQRTAALQTAQVQIVQQEKLSSLGQLVAGVAHEINNPINAIANNVPLAKEYVTTLHTILDLYQIEHSTPSATLQQALEDADIDFVLEDLPKLLKSLELSSDRIKTISTSLRIFSRADTALVPFNLHDGLDSTLLILQHRLKAAGQRAKINIVKRYGELPDVECYPGQINQVFMNLLANAIDALEETWSKNQQPLTIQIQTYVKDAQTAIVSIADNALGIPDDVKQRLFQPMFTTKAIGKGTGLGLSISQQIVQQKHNGQLSFTSVLGKGSEFVIEISIRHH